VARNFSAVSELNAACDCEMWREKCMAPTIAFFHHWRNGLAHAGGIAAAHAASETNRK
jgi:hypothetical protein